MALMKQELEYIEGVLKAWRVSSKPIEPINIISDLRVGWNDSKLESLKRRRARAWNWQKAGLDERIRQTEQHIRNIKEGAAERAATFQSFVAFEDKRKLKHFEEQYAAVKASLPKPESLSALEAQIKSTNLDIMAALRGYEQVMGPPKINDAQDGRLQQDPFVGLFGAFGSPDEQSVPKIIVSFAGLKLYKLVMYSEYLQNRRDDRSVEYLSEAAAWNRLKLRAEIRKKSSEMDALPTISLPNVILFTVSNFPLKNPFARQRQFLEELIAELNLLNKQETGQQGKNERKQREERIKKLRKEKAAVQANQNLDPHERQVRINMYDDAIEKELDNVRNLI